MKPVIAASLILSLLLAACDDSASGGDNRPDFRISTTSLPDAVEGSSYDIMLASSGGTAPVTFSWADGFSAPAWLSLSSAGQISGLPASVGAVPLKVKAVDSSTIPKTATRDFTLQVKPAPAITTSQLARAIHGQPYSADVQHSGAASLNLASALPAGLTFQNGVIDGAPAQTGLFELEFELSVSGGVVSRKVLDLVVYPSIPFTYAEDVLEPNDTRGGGTQLFPQNTPAGRMTMADRHVQSGPLTLNSNMNIPKPDPDDFFRFNTDTVGEIRIDVFYRYLVGEVHALLWYYTGPPTHQVVVVAEDRSSLSDDGQIVYQNAQPGFYYLQFHAPGDANLGLWNHNEYAFRLTFNDLTIPSDLLEADSSTGSVDVAVDALNQGAPASADWTLLSGMPPAGVSFTSDGRFTGAPTEFGLYDFTVEARDDDLVATRDIRIRFYDSALGDYWRIRGERRKYDPANGNPIWTTWGDAMVVAPHPDYPAEGAIYVLGGFDHSALDSVRVFHTDRAGILAEKHFKFEDIGKPMPKELRYHSAAFVQHSYGGYLYVVGGEAAAPPVAHTEGDLSRAVYRLQVADGAGSALSHPLADGWQTLAELPDMTSDSRHILGWGEGGVAVANERIYLVAGRRQAEHNPGSGTYSKEFHDAVLMLECPSGPADTGVWHWKTDTSPYTPRRFPAVTMIGGCIYIAAGREGTVGQTGSGSAVADYIEMYEPDPHAANPALRTEGGTQFPTFGGAAGYYPMYATMNGSLYVWCGWDSSSTGTRALHRFDPGASGVGGTVTRLTDADWGTGFGGGVAHDGKLWVISGIGHGAEDEPLNLRYHP